MSDCVNCLRGFHNVCYDPIGDECCCSATTGDGNGEGNGESQGTELLPSVTDNEASTGTVRDAEEDVIRRGTVRGKRRQKRDAALKDQQSTGRKRAARLYPLNREQSCEWRGKVRMGGGDSPILGCLDGKQQARHHGPDKNTLNNDPGNVHRICHTCHNRWHASNDPDYDPNKPLKD